MSVSGKYSVWLLVIVILAAAYLFGVIFSPDIPYFSTVYAGDEVVTAVHMIILS